jgi:hypothetical protein
MGAEPLPKRDQERIRKVCNGAIALADLNLYGKSLALATDKPRGWEYLLFAQVILDEVEEAKLALSQTTELTGSNESLAVAPLGFQNWAQERLAEIRLFASEIPRLMDSMTTKQEEAFGPHGQSGSVPAIVSFSREIGHYCRRSVQWAAMISSTPVDPVWRDAARELVAAFPRPIIESVEQFANDIIGQINNYLSTSPGAERTLRFSLTLDVIDLTRFTAAMEQGTNAIVQRAQLTSLLLDELKALREQLTSSLGDGGQKLLDHYVKRGQAILQELGELGILGPPGSIPEDLLQEFLGPLTKRTESSKRITALSERGKTLIDRLGSAVSNGEKIEHLEEELQEQRAILKELNELGAITETDLRNRTLIVEQCAARLGAVNTSELQHPGAGYIYLMVNPSMEGLVKIGKTSRNPIDRARELGAATGVPTPFHLIFHAQVSDCSKAERYIHSCLEKRNCRVARNREFFRASTTDAIEIMLEARARFAIRQADG